ncbi:MAG: hypothetical protein WC046_00105 [Candidatus Bathyarchaeia archaeon]|jgi:hypothetical protein
MDEPIPLLSLNQNTLKSETLKHISRVLKRRNIPHVLIVNPDRFWSYHRYLIEVFSNQEPETFPRYYFDRAFCRTKHQTMIHDIAYRERLDIAIKGTVEVMVKGQMRNGANRIYFSEGLARVDEIRKFYVWDYGKGDSALRIDAYIDPYRHKSNQV